VSREVVFRSAAVRPLAVDSPLRVGPKRVLRLEALASYPKLPLGPSVGGGPSRLQPLLPPRFSVEGPMQSHPAHAPQSPRRFGVGMATSNSP
jgi:hypothetical protein